MINALAKRSRRKIQRDGVPAFVSQARYKAWTRIAAPLGDHFYQKFPLLERHELRERATLTRDPDTTFVSRKGPSGCPANPPRSYYRPGPRYAAIVKDASVIAYRGLPLTPDREIIVECVGPPTILPRRPRKAVEAAIRHYGLRGFKHRVLRDPEYQYEGPAAHLLPLFQNYYHWLVESIGKLAVLEEYGDHTGTYPVILVPERRKAWMQDILDLVEYPGDVIEWWRDTAAFGELVVPSYPDPTQYELTYLRDRLLPTASESGPDRVFLDRQDASSRRIQNWDAVTDTLRDHGFVIATPGEHSIPEQIRLVKGADVVAGPHGAGLTNIVFATDTTVIEVAATKESATYARLSEILDHDYQRLSGEAVSGDIHIDPDRIVEALP